MEREARLEWERRLALPAAVAALISSITLIVAVALQASASRNAPGSNDPNRHKESLLQFKQHAGTILAASVCQAIAALLLAAALAYLYRATRHRREQAPSWVLPLIGLAPLLLIAGTFVSHFEVRHIADQFTSSGPMTDARAKHLFDDRSPVGAALLLAGGLAVGLSTVLVSVNAMRAGLLSRFMGVLGVIVGVLFVLPLLPGVPVVEIFWLIAVAAIFLGRWPGGRGPAWESGEAEPWPSAAEQRAAEARAAGGGAPVEAGEPAAEEAAGQPRSRKRKRKRRG